jgi:hypothetical protein
MSRAEVQRQLEFLFLCEVLLATGGNIAEAARRMGMNRYWLSGLTGKLNLNLDEFSTVG